MSDDPLVGLPDCEPVPLFEHKQSLEAFVCHTRSCPRQRKGNLLSNALQHTPSGGSIETTVGETDRTTILVEVHDSGGGMTQQEIERAFERFRKGPGSRGSGLDLTIARNLVLAHGGEIRAASQPGSGTTIRFTLPFEAHAEGEG